MWTYVILNTETVVCSITSLSYSVWVISIAFKLSHIYLSVLNLLRCDGIGMKYSIPSYLRDFELNAIQNKILFRTNFINKWPQECYYMNNERPTDVWCDVATFILQHGRARRRAATTGPYVPVSV